MVTVPAEPAHAEVRMLPVTMTLQVDDAACAADLEEGQVTPVPVTTLVCERVPTAKALPLFCVYACQAARPPNPTSAVPATAAPRTSANRTDRLLLRFSMIFSSFVVPSDRSVQLVQMQ